MTTKNSKSSPLAVGVVFVLTGAFIGVLLTLQFRSSVPSTAFLSDELVVQKELIDSYLADQSLLKNKIVSLREQIDAEQQAATLYGEQSSLERLKQLKMEVGLEAVRGSGVEIALNDGIFVNRDDADAVSESLVHASDLRDVVNILRSANAQAISINDQRIIATTPITSVGNTILVNNFHLLPPFTISAIGDNEILMQRIGDPSTLPDLKRRAEELKVQMDTRIRDGISAPIFNGTLSTKLILNDQG